MSKTTLPVTILNLLEQHLEPMFTHSQKSAPFVASRVKGGTALLVGRGGRAYANFVAAHPELAGETIVVVEWYGMETYSGDPMSCGPAVTLLQVTESPIYRRVMRLEE